ncbi:MAG TPA: biopolymer transporter ExbD [Nevskiaceae bacterium]|nr:biopolymer transporter ExbD [Nevskiaceae bacterium]
MKFRKHAPDSEDTGIDLAPMLDFIMNLLIFFIITTTFISESGIRVNRPQAETAKKEDRANIFVGVSSANEIWVDKQRVDIRTLRVAIEKLKAQHPNPTVIIQADRDARAGLMVEAMDEVRLAGIADVAVAAQPR